ncbi:hypothetical protein D029_4808A, partial [Vibrio parahaemolyticus 970107]
MCRSP